MQCKNAYLFRIILVILLFILHVILCFYVFSMLIMFSKCVLCLFVSFDAFLGQMSITKGFELIKSSWKARRVNFGRKGFVPSRYRWHDSLQRVSVTSRHPRNESWQDQKAGLSSFRISSITSSVDIQIRWFQLRWKDDSKI